jgi:hypothetical protein
MAFGMSMANDSSDGLGDSHNPLLLALGGVVAVAIVALMAAVLTKVTDAFSAWTGRLLTTAIIAGGLIVLTFGAEIASLILD